MKKYLFIAIMGMLVAAAPAQMFQLPSKKEEVKKEFKGEKPKINDLIHTDLKVKFDLEGHTMDGEALIRLKPHYYPTDSLTLDAKEMKIHALKVNGRDADYAYDGKKLRIRLPKTFHRNETYEVYVKYTAYPDSVQTPGGSAIKDHKGLYFINTRGETDEYPPMIWTQGEPEDNSVWFPTIDSPNQKSTQRLEMTVPAEWVTLSNGLMTASVTHDDGTRTDTWEMDKPHAPYLFFMAAGPFAIVKDSLDQMPVWYYVEKKYEPVAKKIFGKTPEMIRYFSQLTGVPYPWDKYHQIVTRQFVSGAMENTTAVNHNAMAYQTEAELTDGNRWESVIAHELFHHWFGDYVTAESWSQIAMNEAFADYSESLWEEHDEGRDKADYIRHKKRQLYFRVPGADKKDLVRFYHRRPDDVFDIVSYQKGGAVLHMLRTYAGDSAFFDAMKLYLNRHKFGTGEADQFRLALEEVTGRDYTEFFDQWFFGSGHPEFKIEYDYNDTTRMASVKITQKGDKIWKFPLQIDVYQNDTPDIYMVTVDDSLKTFRFPVETRPKFINVGARHVLLAKIKDTRPDETYYFQFMHAQNYTDRRMGLDKAIETKERKAAWDVLIAALDDPFYVIRKDAVAAIDVNSPYFNRKVEKKLYDLARHDKNYAVQAEALKKLGLLKKKKYVKLFRNQMQSPSPKVKKAAFGALLQTDPEYAAKILSPELEEELGYELIKYYVRHKKEDKMAWVAERLLKDPLYLYGSDEGKKLLENATRWIAGSDNVEANKKLADAVYDFVNEWKGTGLDMLGIFMLRTYMNYQHQNTGPHKEEILDYYRQVLEKLKK